MEMARIGKEGDSFGLNGWQPNLCIVISSDGNKMPEVRDIVVAHMH